MPALLVSRAAEKTGIPIAEAEHRWAKAKAIAHEEKGLNPSDGDAYWQYVTGVFKNAMGISDDGAVVTESAKGTGKTFKGGKLEKQKGTTLDDAGMQFRYVRHITYDTVGGIAEETYSDDYGFNLTAKTLRDLKKKMASHGKKHTPDVLESVDSEAHKAATSPKNNLPEPTPAQIESGNYKKGHVSIQGLEIAIENPKGSKRRGVSKDGKAWESLLHHHYGYIKGTVGRDKDHIDVFIGDKTDSPHVYVVNQVNPETGSFDEHKCMLGFDTSAGASDAYHANYEKGWKGMGSIVAMSMPDFKNWLENGNTKMVLESIHDSWIGVDLDGTLAFYDGYKGEEYIGDPIPLMLDKVKEMIRSGQVVKIFTARAETETGKAVVQEWLKTHGIGELEVTNIKDSNMAQLFDDRAVKVIKNTGVIIESSVQPNQKPTVSQDQSRKAMKFTLDTQKNTMQGAIRPDIGWIAFLYGTPGTSPLFADGDGLARIIAKQDFEKKYLAGATSGRDLCMRLVDIVTRGYVKRKYGPSSRPKVDFSWQGEVATVSWDPGRKTWYLSAWREDWGGILESAGNRGRDHDMWRNGIRNAKSMDDINVIFDFEFGVTLDDIHVTETAIYESAKTGDFVVSPNGTINFGQITPEIANIIKRQTGFIRMRPARESHIETNRNTQLDQSGFDRVVKLVYEIAQKYNQIYEGRGRSLILAETSGKSLIAYIELEPGEGADFYAVKSALSSRSDYLNKKRKLWDRAQSYHLSKETPSAISGQSFSGKRIKPTGDDVNKIFEGVEVDIKGCDWKNKIRIATAFDDIYLAFRDSGLMDVSES